MQYCRQSRNNSGRLAAEVRAVLRLQPVVTSSQEKEFLKRTLRFIVRVAVTACAYKNGSLSMSRFTKKQKRTSGQGWGLTPKERKAVEECAIKEAMTYYQKWKPQKTEREGIGADLEITKGGKKSGWK